MFAVKSGNRQTAAVELALEIKNVWIEDLNELDPQTSNISTFFVCFFIRVTESNLGLTFLRIDPEVFLNGFYFSYLNQHSYLSKSFQARIKIV